MTPVEQLVTSFQELVGQVPEIIRPVIVMLAGAIPFIEGEVASMIGVVGGLNPVVAGIAAAAGNFLCVFLVVLLTSRARAAVANRRTNRAAADAGTHEGAPTKPESMGRQRFKKWLVRFGVPGASILGPLAVPTQFTSAMLVAGGTPRAWVLLWQAVAIVLWTTVATVSAWLALHLVVPT
ncbi:small multidrug efflux protein [Promicromonospora sp. NPDC090134]|uniref:small multidrug efflux protein n=1 Tax=Promicromonospora sp. NPDC090134 TaxID=3364408 RepID=UPI00381DA850